ncbi:MAG: hypothetical protein M1820_006080 [Bogoriella megaspora]|nr:MAG: hypothetical protein M1820_006080 [Bogoriella megaspora]
MPLYMRTNPMTVQVHVMSGLNRDARLNHLINARGNKADTLTGEDQMGTKGGFPQNKPLQGTNLSEKEKQGSGILTNATDERVRNLIPMDSKEHGASTTFQSSGLENRVVAYGSCGRSIFYHPKATHRNAIPKPLRKVLKENQCSQYPRPVISISFGENKDEWRVTFGSALSNHTSTSPPPYRLQESWAASKDLNWSPVLKAWLERTALRENLRVTLGPNGSFWAQDSKEYILNAEGFSTLAEKLRSRDVPVSQLALGQGGAWVILWADGMRALQVSLGTAHQALKKTFSEKKAKASSYMIWADGKHDQFGAQGDQMMKWWLESESD